MSERKPATTDVSRACKCTISLKQRERTSARGEPMAGARGAPRKEPARLCLGGPLPGLQDSRTSHRVKRPHLMPGCNTRVPLCICAMQTEFQRLYALMRGHRKRSNGSSSALRE